MSNQTTHDEQNHESVEFLPKVPPMPNPPANSDDVAAWERHIEAIDKYLLDLSETIQKIESGDFIENFKKRLAARGLDVDKAIKLPKPQMKEVMEEIAEKMKSLMAVFQDFNRTDIKSQRRVTKSNRNIKSI